MICSNKLFEFLQSQYNPTRQLKKNLKQSNKQVPNTKEWLVWRVFRITISDFIVSPDIFTTIGKFWWSDHYLKHWPFWVNHTRGSRFSVYTFLQLLFSNFLSVRFFSTLLLRNFSYLWLYKHDFINQIHLFDK